MKDNGFLSSSREQHAWHRGLYKGLFKYHSLKKMVRKESKDFDSFKEWEDAEGHYEDVPMFLVVAAKEFIGVDTPFKK